MKLLFFTKNLHFAKSNQISTYRILNFPLTSGIYFVFLPAVEMQKTLEQTKVYYLFLTLSEKKQSTNFLMWQQQKPFFSSVYGCSNGTKVFFTICVQSYFIHIQSSFLYSVSHLICIQSHLIYIKSTYMYSVTCYIYSVHINFLKICSMCCASR